MSEHFYCSGQDVFLAEGKARLTGSEAQHVSRVLRKKPGDEILLFDGSGREFLAKIDTVGKNELTLSILETRWGDREPDLELTMAVALPKGERQKWLIEKLTELGVHRCIPIKAERADIKVDADVIERLKRQVIEASKQCGRLRLMEILPEMDLTKIAELFPLVHKEPDIITYAENDCAFVNNVDSTDETKGINTVDSTVAGDIDSQVDARVKEESFSVNVLTHPITDGDFGQCSFTELSDNLHLREKRPRHVLVVVGPAGGWTSDEVLSVVEKGWPILDLGKQVYRVETAALVVATLFLHL